MKSYKELLKENEKLRGQLAKFQNKSRQNDKNIEQINFVEEQYFLHEKNYFDYIKRIIKRSNHYKAYKKVLRYFRPFWIVTRTFRWIFIALTWIQASALLLVAAAVFLVATPVLVVLLLVFAVFVRIDANTKLPKDREIIENKKVIVIFRNDEWSEFFISNLSELSSAFIVVVVGNISCRNARKIYSKRSSYFLNRQKIGDNIFVVREYYFFLLKNKALKNAKRLAFVY